MDSDAIKKLEYCRYILCDAELSLCDQIESKGYVCRDVLRTFHEMIENLIDEIDYYVEHLDDLDLLSEL